MCMCMYIYVQNNVGGRLVAYGEYLFLYLYVCVCIYVYKIMLGERLA